MRHLVVRMPYREGKLIPRSGQLGERQPFVARHPVHSAENLIPGMIRKLHDEIVQAAGTGSLRGFDDRVIHRIVRADHRCRLLIAEGESTKDVSDLLWVSVKTVEFHKTPIMEELDLHFASALIKFAIAEGLRATNPDHLRQDPLIP